MSKNWAETNVKSIEKQSKILKNREKTVKNIEK